MARIASKLMAVLFRYSLEITPLVEVTPADPMLDVDVSAFTF